MIGYELTHCSNRKGEPIRHPQTGHRQACCRLDHVEKLAEVKIFAADQIPFAGPSAFGGKDETQGGISHIDQVERAIIECRGAAIEKIEGAFVSAASAGYRPDPKASSG